MIEKRKLRGFLLLCCILMIGAITLVSLWNRRTSCMGIRVCSDITQDLEYSYEDYSEYLLFNGEKAAVDRGNSTIYIPQKAEGIEDYWQLEGSLQISFGGCQAYFAEDPAFIDFASAVREGHLFSLYVTDGKGHYMEYQVVFTTLPVLRLDGRYLYTEEETNRDIMEGNVTVWSAEDPDLGGKSSTKSGLTQWRMRGYTTSMMYKPSLKLSLKKSNGENRDESFQGLGSDDDWILNSMVLDDTKMKDLLLMNLWNQMAEQWDWNLKMSTGQYVEVITDGEYSGVFLLQRRIDGKYLGLEETDILLKGLNREEATRNYTEGCEIKHSPYDENTTYELMEDTMGAQSRTTVSLENFVDVNLLLEFAVAPDNAGYKNMYYALRQEDGLYRLTFIPWDMDMSFGVIYDNSFVYDPEVALQMSIRRMEYGILLAKYPELETLMASRWRELRQGTLSLENIRAAISELEEVLTNSGAFVRDLQRCGAYYGGTDTAENLKQFIESRLTALDAVFAQ